LPVRDKSGSRLHIAELAAIRGRRLIAGRAKAIEALTGTFSRSTGAFWHTLQPAALSERGLAAALRDLADGWQEAYPAIAWSLDIQESNLGHLSDEAALAIYRMVQEGLTNIARHSGCSEAGIVISKRKAGTGEKLDILVKDDGRGFDAPPALGGGLQGMEERIRKLGGESAFGERTARASPSVLHTAFPRA